jgi:hypothetical protein
MRIETMCLLLACVVALSGCASPGASPTTACFRVTGGDKPTYQVNVRDGRFLYQMVSALDEKDVQWQEGPISSKKLKRLLDKLRPFLNSQWPAGSDATRLTERRLFATVATKTVVCGMERALHDPPSERSQEFKRIISEELLNGLPFE